MTPAELEEKLSSYPRLLLAEYPTPLEHLTRLSRELGREIYVKRDDGIGPGLGGNKTRKLEYLLADALRCGAKRVVTFGGLQSNHARITAAAARRCGLEPHLFFFSQRPKKLTGNLLLNELIGAKMHFISLGGESSAPRSLSGTIFLVRWLSRILVGPNYFIPVGGHTPLACLGYAKAALELDAQARSFGIENAFVITAAGTGGTLAGLLAGFSLLHSPLKVIGIDVGKLWKSFPADISSLSSEICALLDGAHRFSPGELRLIEERYVGPSYGTPSPECLHAIHRLARCEGLLLDPVYTGKAFAGMLDLFERKDLALGKDEPVIFLHTGGLPALFAFEGLAVS